jgi:hypothetical protein
MRKEAWHENEINGPNDAPTAGLPETRYAKSGDIHIAYQVMGSGHAEATVNATRPYIT